MTAGRGVPVFLALGGLLMLALGGSLLAGALDKGRETTRATVIRTYKVRHHNDVGTSNVKEVELRLQNGKVEHVAIGKLYDDLGSDAPNRRVLVERKSSGHEVTRVSYRDEWYGTDSAKRSRAGALAILLFGAGWIGYAVVRWWRPDAAA